MEFKDYWDSVHLKYGKDKTEKDNWLEKYDDSIIKCKTKIIDLGCGTGPDIKYLLNKNKQVIACDYSDVALDLIDDDSNLIKKQIDISEPLPFKDNSYDLIIADLSLHYFNNEKTIQIMHEIARILTCNGILLARVNSIDDKNFGALQGKLIEHNYYNVDGYNKRFFDKNDINKYFSIIGEVEFIENVMTRYTFPKKLYEIKVEKNK